MFFAQRHKWKPKKCQYISNTQMETKEAENSIPGLSWMDVQFWPPGEEISTLLEPVLKE